MIPNHKGVHINADETWNSGRETWERVGITVLQDIRHELKMLNNLLHRDNFREFPGILRMIRANTTKKRRKPRKKAR